MEFSGESVCSSDSREEDEDEMEESRKESVFSELKPYCLELLSLAQNPTRDSAAIPPLLRLLRISPASALQPFFDYTLIPLLLLLDAAVECRRGVKNDQEKRLLTYDVPITPYRVSDKVAEGVIHCLEELLRKCRLGSVEQMAGLLKKLTYAALLSPSEAAEEFREGAIKCFRNLIMGLVPCSDQFCSCRHSSGLPALLGDRALGIHLSKRPKEDTKRVKCLLAFLQSQMASAAVGHWLSILLKIADTEAAKGQRGSANIRVEAFMALRLLVAKVGSADALAFFLPGVVSLCAKVLRLSKTMISGAAGSVEALDQAIRGLAEYLMIVLDDTANSFALGNSSDVIASIRYGTSDFFLEELRRLPIRAQGQSKMVGDNATSEISDVDSQNIESNKNIKSELKGTESFHVDRTKEWIDKTTSHVNKLLCDTFPHICIHQATRVRLGLLAAVQGLLSRCFLTLKESRSMLLECLFVMAVDDLDEVAVTAQEFIQNLLLENSKHHVERDFANIFNRLTEKLPKMVLGGEESLALSHAKQLLVVVYYSGPKFIVDHLQSPITASRFLDIFALCLSQNSVFTGSLDKLIVSKPMSRGYLKSVAELQSGVPGDEDSKTGAKIMYYPTPMSKNNYELPHMPPWFASVGDQKLYEALARILRLVGSSLMTEFGSDGNLSVILDIPLAFFRKLISEVRAKEFSGEGWQCWYDRTGSGQLIRQASTAACIINEIIFGISDQATSAIARMFRKSAMSDKNVRESNSSINSDQYTGRKDRLSWEISRDKGANRRLIDAIGKILHEYKSSELWDLPVDPKSTRALPDTEVENTALHFFHDSAILHQVIIEGIGIFSLCLGEDFAFSGFLHSSLYLLLENLICSDFQVRSSADAVLNLIAATSGYPSVGHLVLANADYVVDSICRQLRHLDLNPHVPSVLAAMLSYIGVAHQILPLLEEPMRSVSQELEIVGRHHHPELTIPFLKAIVEITTASKREAHMLPSQAKTFNEQIKSKVLDVMKSGQQGGSDFDNKVDFSNLEPEKWENTALELSNSRRYRRMVGSITSSCLTAATPLLASVKQSACLIALDIIEDGVEALAKVEEAYRHETETKEAMEELFESALLYHLKDTIHATDDGTDENRLLPAVNKIWPFLVVCVKNMNPVVRYISQAMFLTSEPTVIGI